MEKIKIKNKEQIKLATNPSKKELIIVGIEVHEESEQSTNGVALKKQTKLRQYQLFWKQLWFSLRHALRWSQLKRQFSKEVLVTQMKLHGKKVLLASLGVGFLLQFCFWLSSPAVPTDEDYVQMSASLVDLPVVREGQEMVVSPLAQENYIERFATVAQEEMQRYAIPASVILALAIVNSNFGTTVLAQKGNNHFGIPCHQNPLTEGLTGQLMLQEHCYSTYENAWTAFRANSLLLSTTPFVELKRIAKGEVRIWASGLEKMEFPNAKKLLPVIQKYNLKKYDTIDY